MKNVVCIQIPYWEGSVSRRALRGLGSAFKDHLKKSGAKCVPVWVDSTLTITVEGTALPMVETMLNAFTESVRKMGGKLSITQWDAGEMPDGTLPDEFCGPGAIIRERLTRKFLMSLPSGAYLASNLYLDGKCAFAEQLGDIRTRTHSWKRAVAAGVTQKLCEVLWTEVDFREAVEESL